MGFPVATYAGMEGRTRVRYREAVMKAKAGTPEHRWRKETSSRVIQQADGRTEKTTVQKNSSIKKTFSCGMQTPMLELNKRRY